MAEFVCTMCGKCCMGMGRYVKITGQIGQGRYAARHELSDEVFYATVHRKYRDDFSPYDRETPDKWCPFLIEGDEPGKYICVIHETAPSFCRNFKCCACRIYDSEKRCAGEVKGRTNLVSDDEKLSKIWNEEVLTIPDVESPQWKDDMISVMKDHGYTVEYYD